MSHTPGSPKEEPQSACRSARLRQPLHHTTTRSLYRAISISLFTYFVISARLLFCLFCLLLFSRNRKTNRNRSKSKRWKGALDLTSPDTCLTLDSTGPVSYVYLESQYHLQPGSGKKVTLH